jgi:hypothetical protein
MAELDHYDVEAMIRNASVDMRSEVHTAIDRALERLGSDIAESVRSLEARLASLERANAERL